MKRPIFMFIATIFSFLYMVGFVEAWDGSFDNKRPYRDSWGNRYKYHQNLWRDTDRDGIINYFDYNDRDPYIRNPYQKRYYPYKRRYY